MNLKEKKPGRPSAITDEVIDSLERAFENLMPIKEACQYAGINPATYYRFKKANPELAEATEAVRYKTTLALRRSVLKEATRNPRIALKLLDRHNAARARRKRQPVKRFIVTPGPPVKVPSKES